MARITCGVYFSNLNHLQALQPRISFGKIDYFSIVVQGLRNWISWTAVSCVKFMIFLEYYNLMYFLVNNALMAEK